MTMENLHYKETKTKKVVQQKLFIAKKNVYHLKLKNQHCLLFIRDFYKEKCNTSQ